MRISTLIWRASVVLLVLLTFVFFGLSCLSYDTIRGTLDELSGDGQADPYTPIRHQHLQLAARLAFVIGICCTIALIRFRTELTLRLSIFANYFVILVKDVRTLLSNDIYYVAVLTLAGAGLRLIYIDLPLRYDEAYSYLEYARFPWFITISKYTAPNNHIFHNLLMNLSVRVFGNAEWAIRMPAFVAGVLVIPSTYVFAKGIRGREAAIWAAGWVACSSPLIEFAINSRGYSLVVLLTLTSWLLAMKLAVTRNQAAECLLMLVAAIGLWTVPTMLFSLLMVWCWLIGIDVSKRQWQHCLRDVGIVAASLVFTGLCYLPTVIVSDPLAVLANPTASLSWGEYLPLFQASMLDAYGLLFRDLHWSVVALLTVAALMGLIYGTECHRYQLRWGVACLLPVLGLILVQRIVPPARVWLFLIPLVASLNGIGLTAIVDSLADRKRIKIVTRGIMAAAILLSLSHMFQQNSINHSTQTGRCTDAEQIVIQLKAMSGKNEPVLSVSPTSAQLVYYALRHDFPLDHFDWPVNQPTALVVVATTEKQSLTSVLQALDQQSHFYSSKSELVLDEQDAKVFRVIRHAR